VAPTVGTGFRKGKRKVFKVNPNSQPATFHLTLICGNVSKTGGQKGLQICWKRLEIRPTSMIDI